IRASTRPSPAILTFTSLPTNCTQWRCQRTGRSIPGLDTSKTYLLPRGPPASSHCSSARLTRLQSSTVTFRGGQSMRTWTSGRFGVPPMRRSARSNPNTSSRVRKASTRLSVSMKKNARAELRPLQGGNVAGGSPMSTECATEVRDHPAIPSARRAMRVEPVPLLRAAPRRDRDLPDPQGLRLLCQDRAEVELYRAAQSKPHGDFRTNFITLATNSDAAMHYNIARLGKAAPLEELHTLLEDAVGGPAPSRVDQRDRTLLRHREVHRNTVGDGDGEQYAALGGRVSIDAVEDEPPVGQGLVPTHVGTVHLMRQYHQWKARAERGAERAPPPDHLADRLVAPQPQAERPGRDSGHDPVPLGPLRQLEARDGGIAGGSLGDLMGGWYGRSMLRPYLTLSVQSVLRALGVARRCARNPVRSARCCGSPNRPGPRGPPAASPYRPGCRDFRPTARAGPTAPRSRRDADRRARCAHPCRSVYPRRTAATRRASRTRAAALRIASPRRWRWT